VIKVFTFGISNTLGYHISDMVNVKVRLNNNTAWFRECLFRSTPKSRPNNMGQMSVRPYVRPYVRPQKVLPIPMKFAMQVEVDE